MIKNINKANELIKQTEKEALEIIKKREFIKSKIVDNSIAIDFIIDCLTKKKYDDLTYSERLFVNDIFENATKEDLEVLKNIYFIDMKEIKEIFLTSPYSDDKIFLEILRSINANNNSLSCKGFYFEFM